MSLSSVRKFHDSPTGVLYAGRVATRLVPVASRLQFTPTQVSLVSLGITLVAAVIVATSSSVAAALLAALLVQAGFVLDCLDGQLARATGRTSDLGAYVDVMSDLVKVFALLAACAWSTGGTGLVLGAWTFLFFVLCQHHVHVTRQFPQRSQREYEESATPWKERLRVGGQSIDVAFAIGEVLLALSVGIAFGWILPVLWLLAGVLPIQFVSYSVRFWRHRYRG